MVNVHPKKNKPICWGKTGGGGKSGELRFFDRLLAGRARPVRRFRSRQVGDLPFRPASDACDSLLLNRDGIREQDDVPKVNRGGRTERKRRLIQEVTPSRWNLSLPGRPGWVLRFQRGTTMLYPSSHALRQRGSLVKPEQKQYLASGVLFHCLLAAKLFCSDPALPSPSPADAGRPG